MKRTPLEESLILVEPHRLLVIEPLRPDTVTARAEPKRARLNGARGRVTHRPALLHCDGDSRIHSAEVMSIDDVVRVREEPWRVVRLVSERVTRWPRTLTVALMRLP